MSREPLTCVALSKQLEESAGGRPESRLGYNEENLNSMEASDRLGILKVSSGTHYLEFEAGLSQVVPPDM